MHPELGLGPLDMPEIRRDFSSGDGQLPLILPTKKPCHDRSIVAGLLYYNQTG